MSRSTQILIGFGVALALLIVILALAGDWGSGTPPKQTVEMSFGNHLVSVKGHYKDLTQELTSDALLISVDGQKIVVNGDQVMTDGLTHDLGPDQVVEIVVDEKGAVHVNVEAPNAGDAAPADGDDVP